MIRPARRTRLINAALAASMLTLFPHPASPQSPAPQAAAIAADHPLRIIVLNGRNGKPVASTLVRITQAVPPYDFFADNLSPTYSESDGSLILPRQPPDIHQFAVSVAHYYPCGSVKTNFSFDTVRSTGTVSDNTCKPKITRQSTPGTLILYVRPYSAFERYQEQF